MRVVVIETFGCGHVDILICSSAKSKGIHRFRRLHRYEPEIGRQSLTGKTRALFCQLPESAKSV
jgi:hypothetical protein